MYTLGTPSVVTLRAPTTPRADYVFSLMYHRTIEPFGANDPLAIRQPTAVDILLDVVSNTPPTLAPPTVASGGTIEADTTGGWTADSSGLSATDAEDVPPPTPGATRPRRGPRHRNDQHHLLGDGLSMTASATFDVTVADRTAPTLPACRPTKA